MKIVFFTFLFFISAYATELSELELKQKIARMLIVGFDGQSVTKDSNIVKDIQKYNLGGVILFDIDYKNKTKQKNISSPRELKKLTTDLKIFSKKSLLISIDQEGGKVARLKSKYGFNQAPSAKEISKHSVDDIKDIYATQSSMLKSYGINVNFAPVVDLEVNPKNFVISGLKRSYGKSDDVIKYAKIMIEEQTKHNIISVLKHFPGHGSSLDDSHEGFVDVSNSWDEKELTPYKKFIKNGYSDMIMSAHVFNKHLDKNYPATLSYNLNTKLLRDKLGFVGVLVSDDMQMRAISKHYSLKDSVTLAINSGVDMLIFGNQLSFNSTDEIIQTIYTQVKKGAIKLTRIDEANRRIENLHTKNSIIQKPIVFNEKRIGLTKEYIKSHYGKDVKDITIKPKSIVLHWTAIMDFDECYNFMKKETLYATRPDIVKASALNVSSHFLVNREGVIYQLMPDNYMARHVIGLNYSAIGIENVGGEGNKKEDLTPKQVEANIKLVRYLKQKYPEIEYMMGHYEYKKMQNTPLWLELDKGYRTFKVDPGEKFMKSVRSGVKELGLKTP
jgi:beta-N-acetylhexosaminidase